MRFAVSGDSVWKSYMGYLTYKKTHPPGTLLKNYAQGPRGVLEGLVCLTSEVPLNCKQTLASGARSAFRPSLQVDTDSASRGPSRKQGFARENLVGQIGCSRSLLFSTPGRAT